MQTSDNLNELFKALSAAQSEIEDVAKNANNPFFKSKYADLAQVRAVLKDVFPKHGLSYTQLPSASEKGIGLVTVLAHASGQYISERSEWPVVKNDPQAFGSALTYARRYSLMAMAGIAADDDDGNAASGKDDNSPTPKWTTPEPPKKPAPKSAPKPQPVIDPREIFYGTEGENVTNEDLKEFAEKFKNAIKTAQSKDQLQQWFDLNAEPLNLLKHVSETAYDYIYEARDKLEGRLK